MASPTKFVCLFFLATNLLCSLQIHARDSQFFSKVSRERDATTNPTKNLYDNNSNEAETFSKIQKSEEEPVFTPQTTGNGYGLYGHETGLDAPYTTPTTSYNMDDDKFEYDTKFYDNNIKNEKQNHFHNNNVNNEFAQSKYFNNNNEKQNSFANNNEFAQTKYFNNNNNEKQANNNEFAQTKYFNNNNEKHNSFANNNEFAQTKYFNNNNNEKQNSFANNNEFAETKYFNNNNEKQRSSYTNNNEPFDENKYFNNNNNEQQYQEKYFSNNNDEFEKYLSCNNEKPKAFTNNNLYDREKNYAPELKGLSEFSYKSKVGPTKYVSNSNNNGGIERQGMSDTRYLENGKYYFDINSEKKFDNTNNNYMSYNDNNDNNNHGEYYKNNYYNGNAMQEESFKNQFPEEGKFDLDDQP